MKLLNIFSIILIIATPVSYLTQYIRLYKPRSSNGVSKTATFLLALSAQNQLVTLYYLFACHPRTQYGHIIANPPSTRDWLILAQLIVQWTCSLLLLILVFATRPRAQSNDPVLSRSRISPTTASLLLTLHCLVALFWIMIAGPSLPNLNNVLFYLLLDVNAFVVDPLMTLAIVIAFIYQARNTKGSPTTQSNALSRVSLALQIAVFTALAAAWPFRLKMPRDAWSWRDGDEVSWLWVATEWYAVVGWPCVNNAIIAIGQAIVLFFALRNDDGGTEEDGERQALLPNSNLDDGGS